MYRSLEALRGVAALGVVLFHSAFVVQAQGPVIENASLFVDFFFVLSGFVMAHAYRARIAEGYSLGAFALLRLGRLYPLHLLTVVVWIVYVVWAIPADDRAFAHHMAGIGPHLTMLNSVGLQGHLSLNYPAWSVGAEFWGCMVFFAVVAGLRGRFTATAALVLALGCYGVLIASGADTIQRSHDLGLVRCLAGFFLGVALQMRMARARGGPLGTRAEVVSILAVVAVLSITPGAMLAEIAAIAAFTLLVAVFARSDGAVSRVLQMGLPQFLGRISYSIYMLHALVLLLAADLARAVGGIGEVVIRHPVHGPQAFLTTGWAPMINLSLVVLVIGLAALSYRWVEAPCRRASRRWVARRWGTGPVKTPGQEGLSTA